MPLGAPSPRSCGRRRSEDREVIKLRIAWEAATRPFQLRQHRLEAHDRRGFLIAGRAQSRLHKFHRQLALVFVKVFEWDAFAVARDEMPVEPLFIAKPETRLRLLFGPWRSDELVSVVA